VHSRHVTFKTDACSDEEKPGNREGEVNRFGCFAELLSVGLLGDAEGVVEVLHVGRWALGIAQSLEHEHTGLAYAALQGHQVADCAVLSADIALCPIGHHIAGAHCHAEVVVLVKPCVAELALHLRRAQGAW